MTIHDYLQIVAFLAFLWLSDWATQNSAWRYRAIVLAGLGLYFLGSYQGWESGTRNALKEARQSAILTERNMPR